MPSVDAVLFDLDETLCTYRRSGSELLSIAFEAVGVEPFFDVEAYYARYADELGAIEDMAAFREACFADLAEGAGRDPELGREVAQVYEAERDQTNVDALAGAHDAVETLAQDHALGLVTNGTPGMQRQKLEAIDLADAFETVVFAAFDAAAKPDPEPFELALSDLGVTPERAVNVGDSLRSDVAGANAAGLQSVWLRPDDADTGHADDDDADAGYSDDDDADAGYADAADADAEPDYVIDAVSELVDPPWA